MRKLLLSLLLLVSLPVLGEPAAPTYFEVNGLKYQYFDGINYYTGGNSGLDADGNWFSNPIKGDICILVANPDYTGTDLVIPATVPYGEDGNMIEVVGIANEAFRGNQTITSVTFPSTFPDQFVNNSYRVTGGSGGKLIGDNIFADCPNLTKVVFSEGMKYFDGKTPFRGCPIADAGIPTTMTKINEFLEGSAVVTIEIPDWVTSISFEGCSKLTEIPDMPGLTEIPANCFSYCTSLENVIIPDNITNIGQYAFSGCSSLKSVVISDNVTYLSMCAFRNCKNLENVVIGSSVKQLGTNVFEGSDAIIEIEFKPTTPPTFYQIGAPTTKPEDAGIFDQTVLDNAVATVPEGTLANYRKQGWFKFAHAQDTTTGIEDITADITTAPEEYFNLQGMQVSADTLTPGIYIRRQGSHTSKIIVR